MALHYKKGNNSDHHSSKASTMIPWITDSVKTHGLNKDLIFQNELRLLSRKDEESREMQVTRRRKGQRNLVPLMGTDSRVSVVLRLNEDVLKALRESDNMPDLNVENLWSVKACRFIIEELLPGPRPTVVLILEEFRFLCRLEKTENLGEGFNSRLSRNQQVKSTIDEAKQSRKIKLENEMDQELATKDYGSGSCGLSSCPANHGTGSNAPQSGSSSSVETGCALSELIELMNNAATLDPEDTDKEKATDEGRESVEEIIYMRSVKTQTKSQYTGWKGRRTLDHEEKQKKKEKREKELKRLKVSPATIRRAVDVLLQEEK